MTDSLPKKIYSGRLQVIENYEYDEFLGIQPTDRDSYVLAEKVTEDIKELGSYLSVRYFITDKEADLETCEAEWVKTIAGISEAEFTTHYSEITGYLYTDETLKVGGHDLLAELSSHIGSWVVLEIEFSKEPKG